MIVSPPAALGRILLLLAAALAASAADARIVREDHHVTGSDGVRLFVRELIDDDIRQSGPPLLLLHGARVPGIASFDLPVPGGSLAADLAAAGHRVFVMDARGYGRSTRPPAMQTPPAGPPLVQSHEVVRDIAAVVDWIGERTGGRRIALLGWATGGHWCGMYASLHPERVSHLVILNSLYGGHRGHPRLGPGSSLASPAAPDRFDAEGVGAYRLNSAASLLRSWDDSVPVEDKSAWRDPAIVAAYQAEALRSDTDSGSRTPPSFRAPSGALEDSFYLASGRQLWDAASITAPVLILRSERDFWSRPEDVTTLQAHLVRAASVRAVTIPDATHFVHLDRPERGRQLLVAEIIAFLH